MKAALAGTVWNSGRQNYLKGTKEFWAPLGRAEFIIAEKIQKPNFKVSRKELLLWIQQSVKTEDNQLTNEAYFQVLQVDLADGCGYFWRPNKEGEWFKQQMDPAYHAKREEEKKTREAIKYAKPKSQATRQSPAVGSDWTPDPWAKGQDAWAQYNGAKGPEEQNQSWSESWGQGGQGGNTKGHTSHKGW